MHHRRPAVGIDVKELHAVLVGTGVVDQKADVEVFGHRDELAVSVEPAQVEHDDTCLDRRGLVDPVGEPLERIRRRATRTTFTPCAAISTRERRTRASDTPTTIAQGP